MDYPAELLEADLSRIPLDDPRLEGTWEDDHLYCARMRLKSSEPTADYELAFRPGVSRPPAPRW
jgi:hypothetical protein